MDPTPADSRARVELSRRAYEALAASLSPAPPDLIPSFRVWHYPPAGPQRSWVVFHVRFNESSRRPPRVRRVSWDRDGDLERLQLGLKRRPSLDPTLGLLESELDAETLERQVRKLVPLGVPGDLLGSPYLSERRLEFGLEGFDIEGSDGRPVVRIEWDRDPVPALRPLVQWATDVRSWLGEILP